MVRQPVPKNIQDELLFRSGKRCCICFGLNNDLSVKTYGQIAHLNKNTTYNDLDNLAYLCPDHYGIHETGDLSAPRLTIGQVKHYRAALYAAMEQQRRRATWPEGMSVPLLDCVNVNGDGVRLTDRIPTLSLVARVQPSGDERWLHIETFMRPALSLGFRVRAWKQQDAVDLLATLRVGKRGTSLHGPRADGQTGDVVYVWHEGDEHRLSIATGVAQTALAIHARLTPEAANALADYLQQTGFAPVPQNDAEPA
ncbi:MAG: hypothetical protein GYB65_02780 [Chloroflexi bacterium]|nr:hypothetical protein [Chloroflexota bacterium]